MHKIKDNPFLHLPPEMQSHGAMQTRAQKEAEERDNIAAICYDLFVLNKDGVKLMDWVGREYFTKSLLNPQEANLREKALYWQAFTEFPRMLINLAQQHRERKDADVRNDTES